MIVVGVLVVLTSSLLQAVEGDLYLRHQPLLVHPPHILPPHRMYHHNHLPSHLISPFVPHHIGSAGMHHHHHHIFRRSVDGDQTNQTEKSSSHIKKDKESMPIDHYENMPKIIVEHNGRTLFESDKYLAGNERTSGEKGISQESPLTSPVNQNDQALFYLNVNGQPMPVYTNLPGKSIPAGINPFQNSVSAQSANPSAQQNPPGTAESWPQFNSLNSNLPFLQNPYYPFNFPGYEQMNFPLSPLLGRGLFPPQQHLLNPNSFQFPFQSNAAPPQPSTSSSTKEAPCPDLYRRLPRVPVPRNRLLKIISPNKYMDTIDHYLYPYIFN